MTLLLSKSSNTTHQTKLIPPRISPKECCHRLRLQETQTAAATKDCMTPQPKVSVTATRESSSSQRIRRRGTKISEEATREPQPSTLISKRLQDTSKSSRTHPGTSTNPGEEVLPLETVGSSNCNLRSATLTRAVPVGEVDANLANSNINESPSQHREPTGCESSASKRDELITKC